MSDKKRKYRSPVWDHFKPNDEHTNAECKRCGKEVKTKGGNTTGLAKHLLIHGIGSNDESISSKKTALDPDEAITKLVAQDCIPFLKVANSDSIRSMFEATTNQCMPKSPKTIRGIMLKCYTNKKEMVIEELRQFTLEGKKFSLTLDEWTSAANRRYMNVNVHSTTQFWNLGLARIFGTFTSETCLSILEIKLAEFHLNLRNDIFGICSDGAAVMKKFGRLSTKNQVLCMAHGIHLAVIEALYKCNYKTCTEDNHEEEEEEEDIESMEPLLLEIPEEESELNSSLKEIIDNVRSTVKIFRKSGKKSEVLAKYSGSGETLLTDTRTRWNSLLAMLERFSRLKHPIQKAMIDLNEQLTVSDNDFRIIDDVIQVLQPVKVAVDGLCRSDANLVTSDVIINFMMGKVNESNSAVGKKLYEELKTRILERRTFLSDVASYLHYGNDNDSLGHTLGYFTRVSRTSLITHLKSLYELNTAEVYNQVEREESEATQCSESLLLEPSLELQLSRAIDQALAHKTTGAHSSSVRLSRDPNAAMVASLKREMTMFEGVGHRGKMLRTVFDMIMTVQPSSVESERAFSCANNFCRKIRTRLGDDTLDALVFLKAFYKKQN